MPQQAPQNQSIPNWSKAPQYVQWWFPNLDRSSATKQESMTQTSNLTTHCSSPHKAWLRVHESAEHRDGCQGDASSNFWGRLLTSQVSNKQSQKSKISAIARKLSETTATVRTHQSSTAKTKRSRRSNAAAWQRSAIAATTTKQINERRNRFGWKWGWKWNIWGWNNVHKERKGKSKK